MSDDRGRDRAVIYTHGDAERQQERCLRHVLDHGYQLVALSEDTAADASGWVDVGRMVAEGRVDVVVLVPIGLRDAVAVRIEVASGRRMRRPVRLKPR